MYARPPASRPPARRRSLSKACTTIRTEACGRAPARTPSEHAARAPPRTGEPGRSGPPPIPSIRSCRPGGLRPAEVRRRRVGLRSEHSSLVPDRRTGRCPAMVARDVPPDWQSAVREVMMGTPRERSIVDRGVAPEPLGKVVPLRVAAQPPPPLEQLVEQSFRIAIGVTALASEVLAEAIARTLGREPLRWARDPRTRPRGRPPASRSSRVRRSGSPSRGPGGAPGPPPRWYRSAELFFSFVTSPSFVQEPLRQAGDRLGVLDARWREQRPVDEEAAASFLRLLVPQVVDAALDQIDLNELVAERIDVDRIIERLDLDDVIARVDIDAVVNGLDIDRIIERIDLQAIVERVPVDADRVAARYRRDRREGRSRPGRAPRRHPGRRGQDRPAGGGAASRPHVDRERGDRGAQPDAADPGRDGVDDERDRRRYPGPEHERRSCDLAAARADPAANRRRWIRTGRGRPDRTGRSSRRPARTSRQART